MLTHFHSVSCHSIASLARGETFFVHQLPVSLSFFLTKYLSRHLKKNKLVTSQVTVKYQIVHEDSNEDVLEYYQQILDKSKSSYHCKHVNTH